MPHEFRCSQCNKLLRTPDGTEGMPAKCPECGIVTQVPIVLSDFSPNSEARSEHVVAPPYDPYADTGQYIPMARPVKSDLRTIEPSLITFSDVFARTWIIFKKQWVTWAAVTFVVLVIAAILQTPTKIVDQRMPQAVLMSGLVNLCIWVVLFWVHIGEAIFFLKIARGLPAEMSDIFTGGRFFLAVLGASILGAVAVFGGCMFFIIPGIIVALMFSQTLFVIVDQNVGAVESLQRSRQITAGNKSTLLAMWIITFALTAFVGALAGDLGVCAVTPFVTLFFAVAYLTMTGQQTADQM